jgi:hypothetical protein
MEDSMDDMEVMQWFFDLDAIAKSCNWHINVRSLTQRKRELDYAVSTAKPAADVMQAYKNLAAAFGPDLMKALLQGDDAFPEVNHSGKPTPPAGGKVMLYVDKDGVCVCVTAPPQWGAAPVFELIGGVA